jgi:hypothetical protein
MIPLCSQSGRDGSAPERSWRSGTVFTPQNTMSRVIKDGVKQLGAYPEGERDLALLWLLAVGEDTRSQYEQWLGTLYGLASRRPRQSAAHAMLLLP